MDLNDPRVQQYLKQVEPLLNDKHVGCLHAIIVATPDGPLKDDSGLTCEQVEEITKYPHQTASARIRERSAEISFSRLSPRGEWSPQVMQ